MKKVTSTLTMALLCLYASAQVGSLDPAFNPAPSGTPGYVKNSLYLDNDNGQAITTYSDGRILVAAYTQSERFTLARFSSTGAIDNSFGTNGVVSIRRVSTDNAPSYAVKILSDNSILVAGFDYRSTKDFALLKLQPDGSPDLSFGTDGDGWVVTDISGGHDEARAMAVQSDGSIVLAGYSTNAGTQDFAVARYTSAGILDPGFGVGGKVSTDISNNDFAESVAIQPDGKIVVGGTSDYNGTNPNFTVVRYKPDGTLDNLAFGTNGIATFDLARLGTAGSNDQAHSLAIQSDGKILLAGQSKSASGVDNGNGDIAVIRLTTAGALDAGFNSSATIPGIGFYNYGGAFNNDDDGRSLALQSDGKIVVVGSTNGTPSSKIIILVARINSDGSFDTGFNGNGTTTTDIDPTDPAFGFAVTLYGNRIYLAGSTGAPKDMLIVAYQNDGTALPLVLSSFYAQKQTSKVVLQWQTASEEGVKQFVIERSSDGKTYNAIGQVAAAGTSSLTHNYTFADPSPFMSSNNYYRLLMQDADGNAKYSKILIVKFDGLISTNLLVYPSPARDLLQVQLPDGLKGNVDLQIIDMNGRVLNRSHLASDGNALTTNLDVSKLVRGVYILKVQAGNTSVLSRFLKQ